MTDSMKFGPEWYVIYVTGETLERYLVMFRIVLYLLYLLYIGCARFHQETVAILVVVAEGQQL